MYDTQDLLSRIDAHKWPVMFWFAHDLSFVYHFDIWFNQIDHWYVKLFWAALVLTVIFETIYLVQVLQYGKAELLPRAGQAQFAALVVAGQVGACVLDICCFLGGLELLYPSRRWPGPGPERASREPAEQLALA